jgi:hypothetical protein
LRSFSILIFNLLLIFRLLISKNNGITKSETLPIARFSSF